VKDASLPLTSSNLKTKTMKTKHLLLMSAMLMLTALTSIAQNVTDKPNSVRDNIPFGKKLLPPNLINSPENSSQQMMQPGFNKLLMQAIKSHDKNAIKKTLDDYRQQLKNQSNTQALPIQGNNANANSSHASTNSDFHLTKDINALAESNPTNNSDFIAAGNRSYAILHQVMYFAADDGIHGNELWRSDGTAAGTFMVMDIEPAIASSSPYDITAVNGKIYFSATTADNGTEPWVSDGTEGGTQLLMDIKPGGVSGNPTDFVAFDKDVYFVTDGDISSWGALWKTDGTTAGTKLVKNLGDEGDGGYFIAQLVKSNGLLFFTFISNTLGFEVWRTDGADEGTYQVGTGVSFIDFPIQLTSYNKKLYFSADDGTGFKLWVSDGTDAGTTPAPGNHDILLSVDYNFGPLPILDNVLYLPGSAFLPGSGLYKYDASNNQGVIKVKDLTDYDFIYSSEMKVVNNTLYFKLDNSTDVFHEELWSSKGTEASTKLEDKSLSNGFITNLCGAGSTLYYVKYSKIFGTELWKIINTPFGANAMPESDVLKGVAGSYPNYLTAFNGKLFFGATDEQKGNELFMTNDFGFGATIVKDINTVATGSSNAGYYINQITPLGNNVLFNAFEKQYGHELYKSDGTEHRTVLLNDIIPGEVSSGAKESYPYNLTTKNNAVYFIASDDYDLYSFYATRSIYKSDGTKAGLQKIAGGYPYIYDFKVADNGLVYYVLNNGAYQLWRSDGTVAGTILLSSTVYSSYYLNVSGNTAFFVAGDAVHGNELWKSDGSVAGTKMVKDINPGIGNSSPKGMFIYQNEVYFAANDAAGASFWKSDGTKGGTIRLRQIDPWYSSTVFANDRYKFEISNNILYFSAINYANAKGTELWRTDGTKEGTRTVKDVSPDADSYYPIPYYLTDVNGTLFFILQYEGGVNGTELWKSDGTKEGTQLVKDITPGGDASGLNNLTGFGGKLYFTNSGALWSSDGTADGTTPVDDAGISDVYVYNIVAASDQLFLSGSTHQYGIELYAGKPDETGKFVASKTTNEDAAKTSLPFSAILYPNPAKNTLNIKIAAGDSKNVTLVITDVSGKTMLAKSIFATKGEAITQLDVSRLSPGTYFLKIINANGSENAMMKFVKQ
jgi:ELWxxDGT repeat protein